MTQPTFNHVALSVVCLLVILLARPHLLRAEIGSITAQEAQAAEQDHPYIHVFEPQSGDRAWHRAVQIVKGQRNNEKHIYTLLRVSQEQPTPDQPVMLDATKLKELTRHYDGGGGQYYRAKSGEFILMEHINGTHRRELGKGHFQDPLTVGHPASGTKVIWIDVPKRGILRGQDIVLSPCPPNLYGQLRVQLRKRSSVRCTEFMLGVVTINDITAGPYPLNPSKRDGPILMAPGDYQIYFAQINPARARFDFRINARQTTYLKFAAPNQKTIIQIEDEPQDKD